MAFEYYFSFQIQLSPKKSGFLVFHFPPGGSSFLYSKCYGNAILSLGHLSHCHGKTL